MQLNAQKRQEFGKENRKLRRERSIPGVVFGKGLTSIPITLNVNDFVKVYTTAGETNLVDLKIDDSVEKVLIKEVQFHPVSSSIVHVNFHKVNLKEKVTASIPVEIEGDEENALVRSGEALVFAVFNEIEIEALPTDLPDAFIVNVKNLAEIGAGITVAELDYDRSKVEILDHEDDDLVVKLDYAVTQEEVAEEKTEAELLEQIEVTGEKPESEEEESDETEE